MGSDQAERWVVISALIVAGVYAYRRLTETVAKPPVGLHNIVGQGSPPPLGTFATAWGVTFLGVSVLASASPELGGAFALLIATGDFLANAPALFTDVGKHGGKVTTGQRVSSQISLAAAGDANRAGGLQLTGIGGGDFTSPNVNGSGTFQHGGTF